MVSGVVKSYGYSPVAVGAGWTEWDGAGSGWQQRATALILDGRALGGVDNRATIYDTVDAQGTVRVRTTAAAAVVEQATNLPFGDLQASWDQNAAPLGPAGALSPLHFTGQPYDAETGFDYFGFRYSNSTLGRWLTPDPAGSRVASPANPQSWNQYAYVMNNPATLVDPFGLFGTDPTLCSTSAGTVVCNVTVNGASNGGIINPSWIPTALGSLIGDIGDIGTGPASGGGVAGGNPTFTKRYLPPSAQTCSAMLRFYAPPGFDLNKIVAAGRAGGLLHAGAAIGHYGIFDFQRRRDSAGNTTFYSGYTPVSNVAVGAYLYGAGYSRAEASLISNAFAYTMSSNAGDPQQAEYRNLGYDLAAAGWNPSCTTH